MKKFAGTVRRLAVEPFPTVARIVVALVSGPVFIVAGSVLTIQGTGSVIISQSERAGPLVLVMGVVITLIGIGQLLYARLTKHRGR